MRDNIFMPRGLPLISDASLIRTAVEFEQATSVLESSDLPASQDVQRQITSALSAIRTELDARGLSMRYAVRLDGRTGAQAARSQPSSRSLRKNTARERETV
jgi:hypothetical protein